MKTPEQMGGIQPDPVMAALVSAAAEAQERFGDDELERFAEDLHAKEKEST